MFVSSQGVNDFANSIKRVNYVRTLTKLWDVTLAIKIKKAVWSYLQEQKGGLMFLFLDHRIMSFPREIVVIRFWCL